MNELETINSKQLPDSISDLASWDKFLSAKLPAYRKLIHNVKSWEEASEEEKRILRRAQEEAENLIDVRVRIGELYQKIPDERGRKSLNSDVNSSKQNFKKTTGLSDAQADRYATLAKHPHQVEQAKADARERNDVVSQRSVMRQIAASAPIQKTVRQKETEILHEAKERHRDFQEKKSNSVVDIQDIQQDKEDRKTIARDLYRDLLSITTKSYWIGALNNSADFDSLTEVIPDDMKESMIDRVGKMIIVLNKFLEVLNEQKNRR